MTGSFVWVCRPDSRAVNLGGFNTATAVIAKAEAHGCIRYVPPKKAADRKGLVRIPQPRLLTPDEWRKAVDSNLPGPEAPPLCRRGCGHSEWAHQFSSATQPYCDLNCKWCGASWGGAS